MLILSVVKENDIAQEIINVFSSFISDEISNKEFNSLYKDRAFSWRGKKVLIRNINIYK